MLTLAETSQTYRLDRISGEVWHLQRSGSRFTAMTLAWKALPMPPRGRRRDDAAGELSAPALGGRVTFRMLVNIHTGAAWTLRTAAGDVKWEAIAVEK